MRLLSKIFLIFAVMILTFFVFDPFDSAQAKPFRTGEEAPLRVNPEQAPAFRPESRRVDAVAREVIVKKIVIHNGDKVRESDIRGVISVKEGDSFNEKNLEEAVSFLKKWGRFEKIRVEKEVEPGGVVIHFYLKEGWIITGIKVKKNRPYMETRIRRKLSLRVGQIYDAEVAKENADRLRKFYEGEGYFGTTVTLKEKFDVEKGTVQLTYFIEKGKRLRIDRVVVEGNVVFMPGFFLSKINPLVPYRPARLRESLEKIEKAYKKKGYPKAKVKIEKLDYRWRDGKIDIYLAVYEGDKVSLRFEGNKLISTRTLKKTVTIFSEGSYDAFEMRQSEDKIIEFYKTKGFPDVKVKSSKKEIGPNHVLIAFSISEGKNIRVKKIKLDGSNKLSKRKIKKDMLTKENTIANRGYFNPQTVAKDQTVIAEFYKQEGFPEATVSDGVITWNYYKDKVEVKFDISEGYRLSVTKINFTGLDDNLIRKISKRATLKIEKPFTLKDLEHDKEQIAIVCANSGYPYAEVKEELSVNIDDESIDVTYYVDKGPLVRVGKILIIGDYRTREKTILKTMSIHEGDVFHYEKVLEGSVNLRKIGAFSSANVETIGLTSKSSVVHLVVRLEETESIDTKLSGTYSTDDKFSSEILVRNMNLFGFGKRASLLLIGGQDLSEGRLSYIDPRFFGTSLEMIIEGFSTYEDRPDFTALQSGSSLSFLKDFGLSTTLLTKYEVSRAIYTEGTRDNDITLPRFLLSLNYDTRDNYADPNRGLYGLASTEFFTELLGAGVNFVKMTGQFAYYKDVGRLVTFSNSIRLGGIKTFSSGTVVPSIESFYLGGDYTVRGFEQDQAGTEVVAAGEITYPGGNLSIVYNFETQVKIYRQFEGALFYDMGTLTNEFSQIDLSSLRNSAGWGIRYITPVGPLRLDYAVILDPRPDDPFGRLHFTFGYAF